MDADELKSLMRKHRVTIRELSRRMGIPMKRIREVRNGVALLDSLYALDWREAITNRCSHEP